MRDWSAPLKMLCSTISNASQDPMNTVRAVVKHATNFAFTPDAGEIDELVQWMKDTMGMDVNNADFMNSISVVATKIALKVKTHGAYGSDSGDAVVIDGRSSVK